MFRRNEIETAYAAKFTPNKDKFSRPHSREHCSVNADQIRMVGLNTAPASSHRKAYRKWDNTCAVHDRKHA